MNKDDNLPYYNHDPLALDALKGEFGSFVDRLTRREFIIINLRYGISYTRKLSLQQIGILFDISRERVRQIETKVLRKLRTNKKEHGGNRLLYKLSKNGYRGVYFLSLEQGNTK